VIANAVATRTAGKDEEFFKGKKIFLAASYDIVVSCFTLFYLFSKIWITDKTGGERKATFYAMLWETTLEKDDSTKLDIDVRCSMYRYVVRLSV